MSVKAESIFEGLHVGALFEEGFLQPVSSSMEVLLQNKGKSSSDLSFSKVNRKIGITLNMTTTSIEFIHDSRLQLAERTA